MSLLPLPTKEEVANSNWEALLAEARTKECMAYSEILAKYADKERQRGNNSLINVYSFLAIISHFGIEWHETETPFRSAISGSTWRSPSAEDLTDEHLELLAHIQPSDPEFAARVYDILWVRRKQHKYALLAINAYLLAATSLENQSLWPPSWHRIERATTLARSIQGEAINIVTEYINGVLKRAIAYSKPTFFSVKLLGALKQLRAQNFPELLEIAKLHAQSAMQAGQWEMAREYWDQVATFWGAQQNNAEKRNALIAAAECYEKQADAAPSAIVAATFLARAIEAYRRIGGLRDRIDSVHRRMLVAQEKSLGDMKPYSVSIDVSELVTKSRSAVQGKSLRDAILTLCRIHRSPAIEFLEKEVKEHAKTFLFQSMMTSSILDHSGKVIARRNPLRPAERADNDAIRAQMHTNAVRHRSLAVTAIINPAREVIWLEHQASAEDFLPLVANNPFVPLGREYIFARGLSAGLRGDLMVSTNLLVPQLENSLRCSMARLGSITSRVSDELTQEDRDLNSLLYESEAEKIWGKDTLFDLRGLLVNKFGANLRNRMAHGLLHSAEFYTDPCLYLWWITLKLVCNDDFLIGQTQNAPSEVDESTTETTSDELL